MKGPSKTTPCVFLVGASNSGKTTVVQPIRDLDEDDPDVVAQRQQHLSKVLRLRALGGIENPGNFGEPVDDDPLAFAEHPFDVVQRHPGVFYRIMQQGAHDARGIEPHLFRANSGHRDGVENVRLTTSATHVLVRFHRQLPCLSNPLAILRRLAPLRPTQQPPVLPGQVALLNFRIGEVHLTSKVEMSELVPMPTHPEFTRAR